MAYQRVEVLSGTERRRSYTPAEKARMVEEAFRPGVVVTEAARRLGVDESLLYRWRRLMLTETAASPVPDFAKVTITPEASEVAALAPPPPPAPEAASDPAAVLEVAFPCGTRVRLTGAVDHALATAVLAVLAPRRTPS